MTPIDKQAFYSQLGALVSSAPQYLADKNIPVDAELMQWLAKASYFVSQSEGGRERAVFDMLTSNLLNGPLRVGSAQQIMMILYRALARAEMEAPIAARNAFIPVGKPFDAFAAIGKILAGAKDNVFIVDPYMGSNVLTDFAVLAKEGVAIRLLTDHKDHKKDLKPAIAAWLSQNQVNRPLEVRFAPTRTLHDRLIVIDNEQVWSLTQSLNAFASRSPATILKVDGEASSLKLDAYLKMWGDVEAFAPPA